MYAIAGKMATSIAAIIITDVIMEKYDVRAKVKDRYAQARTGFARLASQIRVSQGEDESATSGEEAQTSSRLTRRERFRIWEARIQYQLARRASWKADYYVERAIAHARECQELAVAYKRNYIKVVPLSAWSGDVNV